MEVAEFNPEVARLKRQVKELVDAARHNEQVHHRFQAIELALLSAQDFYALGDYLQDAFRNTIKLDFVSLVLLDTHDEISDALNVHGQQECPSGIVLMKDIMASKFIRSLAIQPRLDKYHSEQHQNLFVEPLPVNGSVALLPLRRRDKTLGVLALYSKDKKRYQADAATELLQRLGAITSVCVENCINYEQLRRLGMTDSLTGLANRRELEKRMTIELSRVLRDSVPMSCLYLDVDYFKRVNDDYGHDVGDLVLRKVASVMVESVRLGDLVARFGGEEFVIMLPGVAGGLALETAERIRNAVQNISFKLDKQQSLGVTISIGLSQIVPVANSIGDSSEMYEQLLNRADNALLRAKEGGRNRVVVG